MANAMDAYFRAQQAEMGRGRNMLAMEQAVGKMQREKQLRNILAEAYTPAQQAIPGMPAAPAMGPTRGEALPDYPAQAAVPAQAGRMDMQQALGAMYQGGFGPEAMAMEAKQASLRGATPSMVNEYKFWSQLPKADQEKYLQVKRAQKFLDVGGGYVAPTMTDPTQTREVIKKGLAPTQEQPYLAEKAEIAVTGKELGAEKALLANLEASLPNIQNVVGKLSDLGKIATYTKAGQAADAMARQAGLKMSKGAVARKEYISMVDNEILPLLKQTFGAAFTVEEGKSLKATLGDPDAAPEEKDAVLRSFIDSKVAQIQTKRRRVGEVPRGTQANQDKQALQWANQNPNDPRAMQILQRLGR